MKINKAIEKIMVAKEVTNQNLSDKISPDKFVNISRLLMSENMTVETICKLIAPLGYDLVLQPSDIKKSAYQIPIDFSEENFKIVSLRPTKSTQIRRINLNNDIWFYVDDICSYIGVDTNAAYYMLSEDDRMCLIDGKLKEQHLTTKEGMRVIIEKFSSNHSFDITELSFDTESSNVSTKYPVDSFDSFVKNCCQMDIESKTMVAVLSSAYSNWCANQKQKEFSNKLFYDYLNSKFLNKNGNYFGIRLKTEDR